jgi:hypothetical protein
VTFLRENLFLNFTYHIIHFKDDKVLRGHIFLGTRFIHLPVKITTCPSGRTTCSKGATRLFLSSLHDVPFETHYMVQGCHSPLSLFLARCALQYALRGPRVPLASLSFSLHNILFKMHYVVQGCHSPLE